MSIAAQTHRATLHRLRDRLHRAVRDQKRGIKGADARVEAHRARRLAYIAAHP